MDSLDSIPRANARILRALASRSSQSASRTTGHRATSSQYWGCRPSPR